MYNEFFQDNKYLGMSEKEYFDKYGDLYEPNELLSEKLKKYSFNTAQNHLKEKLSPYHHMIANARKAFRNSISVYKMSNEVLDKIRDTSIDKMPDEVPHLYSSPFIIEPLDHKATLFGDIDSLIGFHLDFEKKSEDTIEKRKKFFFLFHTKNKNDNDWYNYILNLNKNIIENSESSFYLYLAANLFYVRPFENKGYWDFNFIDYNRDVLVKNNFCDKCEYTNDCSGKNRRSKNYKYHLCLDGLYDNLLSFITVFNYMLEADNSPVQEKKKVEQTSFSVIKKGKVIEKKEDWIIKYLYLDKTKIKYEKSPESSELEKSGLISKETKVRGHLRNQACGVGHKDRKWIYIENYVSKKWVKDGDTKIIVSLKKE